MRIAVFDCPSGLSGDMWVGACLDAGLPLAVLREAVAPLRVGLELSAEPTTRCGLAGTQFLVRVEGNGRQPERRLADVLALVDQAALPDAARIDARAVFELLADAEARAHSIPREEVHFHEVGAIDTVVDVICGCAAIHALGIERVFVGGIEVGSGKVRCEHGLLPVPAPATAWLLHGYRQRRSEGGERTTPTGAALLRRFVEPLASVPEFVSDRCGYGAGTRDEPSIPNLARITLGVAAPDGGAQPEQLIELTCNLDTADGETLAWLIDGLFTRGACDAWAAPITMKKGRPAFTLHALCAASAREACAGFLLEESSSLGVRWTNVVRDRLERWEETIVGALGPVRHKCARLPSGVVVRRPEDDEVRRLASERGLGRGAILRLLREDVG